MNENLERVFDAHANAVRRSEEVSTSFYEKIAALSAGSIAVAASVGVSIIAKPEISFSLRRSISHWLFFTILFLLIALIASILHNYLLVLLAKQHVKLIDHVTAFSMGGFPASTWLVQRMKVGDLGAAISGGIAIFFFLASYVLVAVGVTKLWL